MLISRYYSCRKGGRNSVNLERISSCAINQNKFFDDLQELYAKCATKEDLVSFRSARAKEVCLKEI
jgi:enoyl-[acyl-carrier protein] reductase II